MAWRLRLAAAFVLLARAASGDLYLWNSSHPPPISLREAVLIAEEALREHGRKQYCASVSLYGNPEGDGREGAWNFFFRMKDGRQMHVFVNMQKRVDVTEWRNYNVARYPRPAPVRPGTLRDVERGLKALFREHSVDGRIAIEAGALSASCRTRKYQVYRRPLTRESFKAGPSEALGPARGGFLLEVKPSHKGRDYWYSRHCWHTDAAEGPYWFSRRRTYYLTEAGREVDVELKTALNTWSLYAFGRGFPPPSNYKARKLDLKLVAGILRIFDSQDEWKARNLHTMDWDWQRSPPVSLARALELAQGRLGAQGRNLYCLEGFSLWGSPAGGKGGAWQIVFHDRKGPRKHVVVEMNGSVTVIDLGRDEGEKTGEPLAPVALEKTPQDPTDLAGARVRLAGLFKAWGIEARMDSDAARLRAGYRTETVRVHLYSAGDSDFREEPSDVRGPLLNGFWLDVTYADTYFDEPRNYDYKTEPYWTTYHVAIPAKTAGRFLDVVLRIGPGGNGDTYLWRILRRLGCQKRWL